MRDRVLSRRTRDLAERLDAAAGDLPDVVLAATTVCWQCGDTVTGYNETHDDSYRAAPCGCKTPRDDPRGDPSE